MNAVKESVRKTGKLLVLEECVAAGCVGERIAAELAVSKTNVDTIILKNLGNKFAPHGSAAELKKEFGIDANGVVKAIMGVLLNG